MKRIYAPLLILLFIFADALQAATETELAEGMVNPGYEEKPDWFKVSFLDLYDDIDEAAGSDRRVLLYFFQDGCPYCKKLLQDNFGQRHIADKTREYFDVVAINIWGDREVTVGDHVMTEKEFAEALKVQYTPTLLFFNEDRKAVFRANGYYPPERFVAMLDYVGTARESDHTFQDYIATVKPQKSSGRLHTDVATVATSDLEGVATPDRPLLVMFEQHQCATCDELHLDILKREKSHKQLERFHVAVLDMWSDEKVTTPSGKNMKIRDWAKELDIQYAPSLVYFDDKGREVFRSDAYLRAFHTQSVMDYVASGAYLEQPNFQRYIDARADAMREQGIEVNLMD